MLCAHIGADLTVPGIVRTLNGIGGRAGQVVNVVNIGCAVAVCVCGVHLNGRTVVEIYDLGAQSVTGQVAIGIIHFADYRTILLHIEMLACSDAVGQNVQQADLQLPGALYNGNTANYQVLHIALDCYVGCTTVVVNKHRIAGRIINAGTILRVDGKANFLRAHGQLGLEHNVFLVLLFDFCMDLTVPGLVRTLNGIGLGTGQVVNVIDIRLCRDRFCLRSHDCPGEIREQHCQC